MREDFYSKHVGEVYERLTVVAVIRNPKPKFVCDCSCGGSLTTDVHSVLHKKTKSCGCLHKEVIRENGKKNLNPSVDIGQKFTNKQGRVFEVVTYEKSSNVLVRFTETGYEKWSAVKEIKKGSIRDWIADPIMYKEKVYYKPRKKATVVSVGEVYSNYHGCKYQVLELLEGKKCRIKFLDEFSFEKVVPRADAKRGVRNPYRRSASGVGYIGEGEHTTTSNKRIFSIWSNMFTRCYDEELRYKTPSYSACSVEAEWHNFQVFSDWCLSQKQFNENPDWHLDKDIIEKGNKVYGPSKCSFVPQYVNAILTLRDTERGEYPLGVHFDKRIGRYIAQVNIDRKRVCLGRFSSPEEAFLVYKQHKESYLRSKAIALRDKLNKRTYEALLNWKVEITD